MARLYGLSNCLNPYSNGLLSEFNSLAHKTFLILVLILILMDYSLSN